MVKMLRLLMSSVTIVIVLSLLSSIKTSEGKMLGKLLQFGYLRERAGNSRNEPPKPEEITEALIKFQKFNGLPETGLYDKRTEKLLNSRRCGNKDFSSENDPYGSHPFSAVQRWDKKELTWNLVKFSETQRLSHEQQIHAIERGLGHWSKVTSLTFKKVSGKADIMISFERKSHGDSSPFDGPGGVLAHAFFPGRSDISGDTHFDDAELWTAGTDVGTNLEIVAAHEFGHALGLGHSAVPESLMAPYYRGYTPNFQLHPDDIAGIQMLYGVKQNATLPTTTNKPTTKEPTTSTTATTSTVKTSTTQKLTTTPEPSTSTRVTTTVSPSTPEVTVAVTSKQPVVSLCNRPADSKIQAAFTDAKGVAYIFLNTGHVISNVTGSHKIEDLFVRGPKNVDAAAYSSENSLLLLFRGNYMWMYKFDGSSNTFYPADKFMEKLDINVDAATVILDNYGWERIFLFTGQYMHEYHHYFSSVGERTLIDQLWYGSPTVYDAILADEKEINFLHGNSYTRVERRYNVVVSVPRPVDELFGCA